MDAQVVDAGRGDGDRPLAEAAQLEARHCEAEHLPLHGQDHGGRVELDRGAGDVPVERVVQVLVERDADEQPLGHRVARDRARVAVGDAGGELLQGHVDEAVERAGDAARVVAARHVVHALALERDRVHGARHQEVVPERDRVATLLGGPAPGPLAPGALPAEEAPDGEVIVGEVVLGQQVELERGARHGAQA